MDNTVSYFIIGGTGFLGNAFSTYLKQKKITACNLIRGEIFDPRTHQLHKGIFDKIPVSKNRNIIIDFAYASVPHTSFFDPIKDFSVNLNNINCHLDFAAKLPNATYIYISSGGTVYGNVEHEIPIKEDADNFPISPYGISKLASEKYTFMHKEIYGLDIKIVRPANIYGPGQRPFRGQGFIATAISKMILQEPIQLFGNGTIIRDYLHVDDFCRALYSIVDKGINGNIYNVGSQIGYSTSDVLKIIKRVIGSTKKYSIEYLPQRPFDVAYNVLDCSKVKTLNNYFAEIDLESGILSSYTWLKEYLSVARQLNYTNYKLAKKVLQ